jgi:hypothetical protein
MTERTLLLPESLVQTHLAALRGALDCRITHALHRNNAMVPKAAFAILALNCLVLTSASSSEPILNGLWELQDQMNICPYSTGCGPITRKDFFAVKHVNINLATLKDESRVRFVCGTNFDGRKEITYYMQYTLDNPTIKAQAQDLILPVKFTIDGRQTIDKTGKGGYLSIAHLSGEEFNVLASPESALQINVQGNKPYTIKDTGYGLSDFKALCELQINHKRK